MHPAHFAYIRDLPLNTADYFLELLDKVEPERRREIVGPAAYYVVHFDESQDFQNSDGDYEVFKQYLRESPHGHLLIIAAVHLTLFDLLNNSDPTTEEMFKKDALGHVERFYAKELGGSSAKFLVENIERVAEIRPRPRENYILFCEKIVQKLPDEFFFPAENQVP